MSFKDIMNYIKEQAKFLGSTFLYTVVGGIVGVVTNWFLGEFSQIPVVTSVLPPDLMTTPIYALPVLGATLGFATAFILRMRKPVS
jgi:hypothetical protein